MMKSAQRFWTSTKDEKGQVAIFVALIFQILFLFFAMVINVGLLVHHKINLQNSVDLAAYYAGTKQAEALNAIAHINYQIRQSWKLMVFRYRQLGMAGSGQKLPAINPYGYKSKQILKESNDQAISFEPSFCVAYDPFDIVVQGETYCNNTSNLTIPLPGVPNLVGTNPIIAPFVAFQNAVNGAARVATSAIRANCEQKSTINYFALARFIYAYKIDVANRKELIYRIASAMSDKTDDFQDLSGESVMEGVKNTLEKNLTIQNKEGSLEFHLFNSLAEGECAAKLGADGPPGWLSEIYAFPVYRAMEGRCGGSTIEYFANPINIDPAKGPLNKIEPFTSAINEMVDYVKEGDASTKLLRLYKTSMGFEKNPWCMAYAGVSAKSTPKIPFSPFGSVTLVAKSFAKPFGGTIGPWDKSQWTSSSSFSDSGDVVEPLKPIRVSEKEAPTNMGDEKFIPNFNRYIGDELGAKAELSVSQHVKAVYESANPSLSLSWWNNIQNEDMQKPGESGDIVSWNEDANAPTPIRDVEISAIAPDQFDLSYYSIEPDFYHNYFLKLEKRWPDFNVRGDLGSRKDRDELKSFSVRNHIYTFSSKKKMDISKLSYFAPRFAELLTSYQSKTPEEHLLDAERFGKCQKEIFKDEEKGDKPEMSTYGNCTQGGRTGYSVKLVNGDFLLRSDLELGGAGVTGSIKNGWPKDF